LFLVGVIFNGIGNGIINVVLQLYFVSIGISSATLGSIIMMNALSAAILTIPMGILADRYGKKKLVYICAASTVVSAPLLLFTRSVLMFKLAFLSWGCRTQQPWFLPRSTPPSSRRAKPNTYPQALRTLNLKKRPF